MTLSDVEFEVTVPSATIGESVDPEHLRTIASVAEANGFDAVSTGDHVTIPTHVPDEYPFSADGTSPLDVSNSIHDAFLGLAELCHSTDAISLGTNVCVVPYRHPLVLARQVLTLAARSGGRFEFGVGVGWLRTEFDVLDVPFDERGSRTDEFLDIFERACEQGRFAFDGPHHCFDETGLYPTPESRPRVMVGGDSKAAFRRTAKYGDGWTVYWLRPEAIRSARAELRAIWNEFDRDGTPEIVVTRPLDLNADTKRDTSRPMVGAPESIAADIEAYLEVGVTRITLAVDFFHEDIDSQVRQLEHFADEVMTQFE